MNAWGVKPELEVFDTGMMNYLHYMHRKGMLHPPFYVNVILGNIAGAQLDAESVAALLANKPSNAFISLGGIGKFQLDTHLMALALNLGVRIGLEDNTFFDRNREKLASNQQLLSRLHHLLDITEREYMKPSEFGDLEFYNERA